MNPDITARNPDMPPLTQEQLDQVAVTLDPVYAYEHNITVMNAYSRPVRVLSPAVDGSSVFFVERTLWTTPKPTGPSGKPLPLPYNIAYRNLKRIDRPRNLPFLHVPRALSLPITWYSGPDQLVRAAMHATTWLASGLTVLHYNSQPNHAPRLITPTTAIIPRTLTLAQLL